MRMLTRWRLIGCACCVAALGCGDSTSPTGRVTIRVISGGGISDTIQARLAKALIVEVRDSTGKLASGKVVRFSAAPPTDPARSLEATLLFEAPTSNTYTTTSIVTSDASGQASILVALGTVAGTARAIVLVPAFGLLDTVAFSVVPGAAARVVISPRDTSANPGTTYGLGVTAVDRDNNTIPGATFSYSAGAGIASVSSNGQVTVGGSIARAQVVVTSMNSSVFDTAFVSILPKLPLVLSHLTTGLIVGTMDRESVELMNLDGTGDTVLVTSTHQSLYPSAVRATSSIAYYEGDPNAPATLSLVTRDGAHHILVGPALGFSNAGWPRISQDGAWVYFTGTRTGDTSLVAWRIGLDGSNLDSLGTFNTGNVDHAPADSPDGRTVALEDKAGLKLIDVTTKSATIVPVPCGEPHYSPDGSHIACVVNEQPIVMLSNGTGSKSFAGYIPLNLFSGVDWTPDGQWLLVDDQVVGGGVLLNVQTGGIVPVPALDRFNTQFSFIL